MTIDIDAGLNFNVNFHGHEGLLVGMIGALKFAENWATDRVVEKQRVGGGWGETKRDCANDKLEYDQEVKVPKETAIEAYEFAIKALEMRKKAIKGSTDEATFMINPEILSKL